MHALWWVFSGGNGRRRTEKEDARRRAERGERPEEKESRMSGRDEGEREEAVYVWGPFLDACLRTMRHENVAEVSGGMNIIQLVMCKASFERALWAL